MFFYQDAFIGGEIVFRRIRHRFLWAEIRIQETDGAIFISGRFCLGQRNSGKSFLKAVVFKGLREYFLRFQRIRLSFSASFMKSPKAMTRAGDGFEGEK